MVGRWRICGACAGLIPPLHSARHNIVQPEHGGRLGFGDGCKTGLRGTRAVIWNSVSEDG